MECIMTDNEITPIPKSLCFIVVLHTRSVVQPMTVVLVEAGCGFTYYVD